SLSMSKTTIHKAGHWVGLYHMFQVRDMVDDTPAEDDSTYGCYISCDTCPHVPGENPIHTYTLP
ncbi:hypothetical protein BDQ17DRAFT_1258810, partial [Cyathus striatus]